MDDFPRVRFECACTRNSVRSKVERVSFLSTFETTFWSKEIKFSYENQAKRIFHLMNEFFNSTNLPLIINARLKD